MFEYFHAMLTGRGLAPHGYCLLWDPRLIWTHVTADFLIGLAYFSIPLVLARFLSLRRDVRFGWAGWMFAAFIGACGLTHFMSIFTLWIPAYGIQGLIKAGTATVSVATAVALWPLLPRAVALPSPAQLEQSNQALLERMRERDAALAALTAEKTERERAEDMLRQAQKMDAVGQLTSGIAHDFNNLLMIVSGNLERAKRLSPSDDALSRALDHAQTGAARAAQLTHQLLAFSRHQPLTPVLVDLNDVVRSLLDLLRRTLGPQYRLDLDLQPDLPQVRVDRTQLENVILNLSINARDAMPDGGSLTFASRGDGDSVLLEVRDNGPGMTREVAERAFEPFFTTKPVGSGTGLGLSQVYGFARQSNGEVTIRTSPGEGTAVIISLPTAKVTA